MKTKGFLKAVTAKRALEILLSALILLCLSCDILRISPWRHVLGTENDCILLARSTESQWSPNLTVELADARRALVGRQAQTWKNTSEGRAPQLSMCDSNTLHSGALHDATPPFTSRETTLRNRVCIYVSKWSPTVVPPFEKNVMLTGTQVNALKRNGHTASIPI